MKFTREQVIEMAREAGFPPLAVEYISEYDTANLFKFATLAADAALEAAAVDYEKYDSLRIDGAGETIRAMKEHP
jgi:hypothetical protein